MEDKKWKIYKNNEKRTKLERFFSFFLKRMNEETNQVHFEIWMAIVHDKLSFDPKYKLKVSYSLWREKKWKKKKRRRKQKERPTKKEKKTKDPKID